MLNQHLLPHLKTLLIAAAGLYCLLLTQSIAAATLTIVVNNVSHAEGSVMVAVLPGEAGFKEEQAPAAALMQPAKLGTMTFTAEGLEDGEYAIQVMHDVNGNGKLDANFIGMPIEPWAMSNNARGNFGPPTWEDVRFELKGEATQELRLEK